MMSATQVELKCKNVVRAEGNFCWKTRRRKLQERLICVNAEMKKNLWQ